jgi:hypothetical protein
VFVWFNVSTRWEPQACIDVIDKKNAAIGEVDRQDV